MTPSINSNTPKVVGAIAIGGIVTAGAFVFLRPVDAPTDSAAHITTTAAQTQPTTQTTSQTESTTTTSTTGTTQANTAAQTYTKTLSYYVPRETNSIHVSVTIADGVITSVETSHDYSDRESGSFINRFENGVQSAVVGKNIKDISATRIGGASLTSQAFYDALQSIAEQVS